MDKLSRENIVEIFEEIHQLDHQLVDILVQRTRLFDSTLGHKDMVGEAFEEDVITKVTAHNAKRLPEVLLMDIMRSVNAMCRAKQETPTVYYLGPAGTYSEQAAFRYFGRMIHGEPQSTISEVIKAAAQGGYGVVPYENSLAGMVQSTSESLETWPVTVVDIISLAIEQCLLTKESCLEDIKRIYSHEVSLMQCARWLKANMPDAELCGVSSNAEAMRLAALEAQAAAIGGAHGAPRYQLRILREGIQDTAQNITKFLVICAKG